MVTFPWLETIPLLHALSLVLTLVEGLIVIVVGAVILLYATLPQSYSSLEKEERVLCARAGVIAIFILAPVLWALGLYINAAILTAVAIGILLVLGRAILLVFGK